MMLQWPFELVDRNPEAKKVDKPKKIEAKDKKKEAQPQPKAASNKLIFMPKSYTVDDDYNDSRLDKWFKNKVINLPHSLLEKILRQNKVKVNKKLNHHIDFKLET